jgi:tetratricopeptide (TPR) repeat protein
VGATVIEFLIAGVVFAWTTIIGSILSFTFADWIKISLAIVGGVYGIYQAYVHAERRIHLLLDRYFSREQEKLASARRCVLAAIVAAHRTRPVTEPIYSNRELRLAVRSLRLGNYDRATLRLRKVGSLADQRRKNIEKYRELHTRQTATSHLFLGAIAAAKLDHATALKHFQDALEVDPQDLEAMEYAGQQLLKLGHPEAALEYFNEMRRRAQAIKDPRQEMRALRHCAQAYQSYAQPQWTDARRMLLAAELLVPKVLDPLDAGFTLECLGSIRKHLRSYRKAKDSLADALVRYSASRSPEAIEGSTRVGGMIAEINALQSTQTETAEESELADNQ